MVRSTVETIAVADAPAPQGPYSPAVRAGDLVFLSGQGAIDPILNALVGGDIQAQTKLVLSNLLHVLKACGGQKEQVVKSAVFLQDAGDFTGMNEVYAEFFGTHKPARTTVQATLVQPGMKVEIDWVACVPAR